MGISTWRGKFDKTKGSAVLDLAARRGRINIVVDLNSVDFGHAKLNQFMVGPEFFYTAKSRYGTYQGTLTALSTGRRHGSRGPSLCTASQSPWR